MFKPMDFFTESRLFRLPQLVPYLSQVHNGALACVPLVFVSDYN